MPDSNPPTAAELWRRLDDVVRRFEDVAKDVREFRNWAERLYVPRGEWVEGRRADQGRAAAISEDVAELKAERAANQAFRRQVLLALAVAALSAVVSVSIAIAGLLLGRGP